MSSLSLLKEKALNNPSVKEHYDNLEIEFQVLDMLLAMRNKAGMTQEEVALKMGTRKSNISRLENGRTNPKLKTLSAFAEACGCKLELHVKPA